MKGLSCQCLINTEGRFQLISGVDKYRDAIWFFSIFDKVRVYSQDYGANFITLVQQPISSLLINRTILLGKLQRGIMKYVPGVAIMDLDIGYLGENRKDYVVKVDYVYKEQGISVADVTFI